MRLLDRAALVLGRDLVLGTLLERLARIHGRRHLVEDAGSGLRLTYAEAAVRVDRLAGGVAAAGGGRGQLVVVAPADGYELFLLCLAVSRAGGVAVPVNPRMTEAEVDHVVADSGAVLVVRDAAEVEGERLGPAVPARPSDVAAVFYTSGTTGRPKGVQLTHRALLSAAARGTLWPAGARRDEVVSGMPVAHVAGFAVLVACACAGVPVHLLPRFRAVPALDAIESRRATVFVGVPAMYRMLLEAGAEHRDLTSVRLWVSGADVMPDDLARRFRRMGASVTLPLLGCSLGDATFVDVYGAAELAGGVAVKVSTPLLRLPLVPLPGYRFRAVDAGDGDAGGAPGELAVKGPGALVGYHGDEAATRDVLDDDGWVRTGDLVRRGPFGTLHLAGRRHHVIKHGGYSVYATEVERALEEHPAVAEAAVVGLPDERKGEVPAAVVRLRAGTTVTTGDLVEWARTRLADYKAPRQVRVVGELPRAGTGKVRKDDLRALFDAGI